MFSFHINYFNPEKFHIHHQFYLGMSETRERSAAGRVAIYTRHTLNAFKRTDLRHEKENSWIQV